MKLLTPGQTKRWLIAPSEVNQSFLEAAKSAARMRLPGCRQQVLSDKGGVADKCSHPRAHKALLMMASGEQIVLIFSSISRAIILRAKMRPNQRDRARNVLGELGRRRRRRRWIIISGSGR